eukprot:IDg1599t1
MSAWFHVGEFLIRECERLGGVRSSEALLTLADFDNGGCYAALVALRSSDAFWLAYYMHTKACNQDMNERYVDPLLRESISRKSSRPRNPAVADCVSRRCCLVPRRWRQSVSLARQSTHDEILAKYGRFHRRADVFQALDSLHRASIDNVSVDLVTGLSGLTILMLEQTLSELTPRIVQHQVNEITILEPVDRGGRRHAWAVL